MFQIKAFRRLASPLRRSLNAAMLAAATLLLAPSGIAAAEITVLSAAAVQVPVTDAAESFERANATKVAFTFATGGGVDERIAAGMKPDLVINASNRIAVLAKVDGAFVRPLGTVRIGVAAAAGTPHPDLSSVEAFRQALLQAKSIAYGDPAKGATTGIHFDKVVDQLGLREALAGKIVLAANGLDVMRKVAKGEVALGITQTSEILHIDAKSYVGPLPDALQLATTYSVWLRDPNDAAARALVEAMIGNEGRARFRAAGFD